ncbi:uncharacterized protein LOC116333511 isoform X1 [Oreochromis aureus]|uniref:uncharacterized protein LOC116333511 isoform X1 n=1 Tax=Oreochromis aureus TaxID=47969 RepID=UPI001953C707|nr:uncharacterized protein LOC116333511 isoform X1 [Oreochromis aureus]
MKMNTYGSLFAFFLASNVATGLIHEAVEVAENLIITCPLSVEGKVTWSREIHRRKVDLLTSYGDAEIRHIRDADRYSSFADGFLLIVGTSVSDSGTYLCNNQAAVELTVIPSGTTRRIISEKTTSTLHCPHDAEESHVPVWSRKLRGQQRHISPHSFTVDQMLIITDVQLGDSGLYYCDGKPAVYLDVIKDERSERGIFYEVAEVMQKVVLTCPHIVEGKITWSKERYGMEVDIFTTSNDRSVTDFNEHEGYNSWVGSLLIRNTSTSVSGRYFCDRKPAVELIVPPSGTRIRVVSEWTNTVLTCPHVDGGSDVQTWSRELRGEQQHIWPNAFTVNHLLFINHVQPADSGLYYCDGKPAVYLHVTTDERSDRGEKNIPPPPPQQTTAPPAGENSSMTTIKILPAASATPQTSSRPTRGLIHEAVEVAENLIITCPLSVEGKVTWSREIHRRKVDLLTSYGDAEIRHIRDADRYSSFADGFLLIVGTSVSDSGTYLCNNQAAVELTVIPSGTTRRIISEKTTSTLHCPHDAEESHVPVWSRKLRGQQRHISPHSFTVDQMLIITDVQLGDSGLYYCDGKPAVYLDVIKDERSERGIFYEVAEVMQKVVLTCPHIVEGKITWSKERYGMEVDIFTTSNDRSVTDFNEHEGYNSWVGSLLIRNTSTSVSGRYFCDRKPAVELIVPPSGTRIRVVSEWTNTVLTCPHVDGGSDVQTWSRELRGEQQHIWPNAFTVNHLLFINHVQPADSGLYYCDGKPAVYLHVTTEERSDRGEKNIPPPPPQRTTAPPAGENSSMTTIKILPAASATPQTSSRPTRAADHLWHMTVRTLIGLLCLTIMISITAVTWRKARRIEKQKRDTEAETGL